MRDYYKVLGVNPTASEKEIKDSYRKLVLQFHPDRNPHDPHAADILKMINEAYDVLSDPIGRSTYDSNNGHRSTDVGTDGPAGGIRSYENAVEKYDKEWAEIWRTPVGQQYSLSPFITKLLKIDFVISIAFMIYCFNINSRLPTLPSGVHIPIGRQYGGGGTWMTRLIVAGVVGPIISIWALFQLSRTTKSHFLIHYLVAKLF